MIKKNLVICIIFIIMLLLNSSLTMAASWESGGVGINDYKTCSFGNRVGASYVTELTNELKLSSSKYSVVPMPNGFLRTNANAWETDLKSRANTVEFFAFAGHGLNMTERTGELVNSAHLAAMNSSTVFHTGSQENHDACNATSNEVRWGGTLNFVNMYCCNWLTNNGNSTKQDNIFKQFEGANMVMGFASVMWLDSREGKLLAYYLRKGDTYKDAFLKAARYYQTQRTGGNTIARVIGTTTSVNAKMTARPSIQSQSNWYKNNPSLYTTIVTESIAYDGKTKPTFDTSK